MLTSRYLQVSLRFAPCPGPKSIGVARPMNVTVYTEGTGKLSDERLSVLVNELFDLRPKGIIQMLDLLRPIYRKTAAYGHFGRDEPEFSWENVDRVDALRDAAGVKGKVEMAPV